MDKVNLADFELVLPPQNSTGAFAVNICHSGYVNLNGKLMQNIKSSKMALRVNQNGREILLAEQEEPSFRLPKSGSIKAIDFTRDLAKRGIRLPARYSVAWNDELKMWRCQFSTSFNSNKNEKRIKSPRKTGLQDMMP
ncbi:MAG: hypothetical protein WA131_08950 [Desulfitobacteriaceae bacterium]